MGKNLTPVNTSKWNIKSPRCCRSMNLLQRHNESASVRSCGHQDLGCSFRHKQSTKPDGVSSGTRLDISLNGPEAGIDILHSIQTLFTGIISVGCDQKYFVFPLQQGWLHPSVMPQDRCSPSQSWWSSLVLEQKTSQHTNNGQMLSKTKISKHGESSVIYISTALILTELCHHHHSATLSLFPPDLQSIHLTFFSRSVLNY